MSNMSELDWERIKNLIHESVREAIQSERMLVEAAIDAHSRGEDHVAFKTFLAREKRNAEMWNVAKKSAIGVVTVGTLVWIGNHAIQITTIIFGK